MPHSRFSFACCAAAVPTALALLTVACFGPLPPPPPQSGSSVAGSGSAAGSAAGSGSAASKSSKTAGKGSKSASGGAKAPGPTDGLLAGSHILISFKGAKRAKSSRSAAAALAKAKALIAKLEGTKVTMARFAALAREHSEGPSAKLGGSLGTWKKGRMVPVFDTAILNLQYGAVTATPVKSPFGYHVIMRHRVLPKKKLYAAHIVVAYQGAVRAPPATIRNKPEAAALCAKVAKLAKGAGEKKFKKLVLEHSDGPGKVRGGMLPPWNTRGRRMPSSVTRAVYALKIGETSGPVFSPFGCHIFRRMKRPPRFSAAHILISYAGARRAKASVSRVRSDAIKLARKLAKQLAAIKDKAKLAAEFSKLATTMSDGPSAKRGGSLGTWFRGQMVPAFEAAVTKLAIGAVTPKPVETPFGFHVIMRKAVGAKKK